uniref:Uncharacterized protein n=1 Tax=Parascaris equorum TaxID=6256 RepID=A0A914REG5_PAREQ
MGCLCKMLQLKMQEKSNKSETTDSAKLVGAHLASRVTTQSDKQDND